MRKELEKMQAGSKLNTLIAADTRAEMERALANAEQTAAGAKLEQAALSSERDGYIRGWRAERPSNCPRSPARPTMLGSS